MPQTPRLSYPDAALAHLVGTSSASSVLAVGGPASFARTLARAGHEVFVADKSPQVARAQNVPGMISVAAAAEALPFDPCRFDVVAAHQVFHRFGPQSMSEIARVLRPGGHASISYLVRDDTVPWVRRLVSLVQQVDPRAMSGDYGTDSIQAMQGSKYFPRLDQRSFRVWVPMTRDGLLGMIAATPGVAKAPADERELLLDSVLDLYKDVAPGPYSLQLPYLVKIWRAYVDHEELTAPIEVSRDALTITI